MKRQHHVVVIGGGTGGLCLAQALHKAGVSVAVYERSRTRTERLQGYRVHINPHGSQALHECLPADLWQRFVDTCGSSGGNFAFLTEQLDELLEIGDDLIGSADPASGHHSVSRITLHQVLSAGLDGILHYDKEFVRYERNSDGTVTCHFADGTTATGDIVVAADGGGSRVRQQYLPSAGRVDTGIVTVAGKFPLTDATRNLLPSRLVDGPNNILPKPGRFMFCAPHDLADGRNDETYDHDKVLFDNTTSYVMWAFAAGRSRFPANVSDVDGIGLRNTVGRMIEDWHPGLRTLVAGTPGEAVSLLPIRTSVPVKQWPTTNITLLGDAIHSMTPFGGIGANTALRDARLLSHNIIDAVQQDRDMLAAIADYERQMVEYGFAAVRSSLRNATQAVSEATIGRVMFKTILRVCSAVPMLKRKMFSDLGSSE
ncbi:FAD-dependent oxidoreductase [Actinocrispum wychmicini]|uniref:2-polyprenyl-6-methoxyphenol hydroxylase-like FAD-dependent oxidoreductase n=1 Tax=Actinocrispum wychmicini TaxID=1213861 RepID=A0A4R2J0D9_9PSEU|nr:NAD(P)/FAD-dependent oxidoreductase [Actinocrispum wychmicini]TCO50782.1 2-polyprenyl-6-methoxyphenol hydroxylase-like FAD-dependent oxidoreductase [Actinocrispum wychmicini]